MCPGEQELAQKGTVQPIDQSGDKEVSCDLAMWQSGKFSHNCHDH